MMYLGDYIANDTVYFLWSTNDDMGASITRAVNGLIYVYKDGGTTQTTAGITDVEDFDGITGVHACVINLAADPFYATGSDYSVVLSGSTIDSQTVNAILAHFSIQNRYTSAPTTSTISSAVWGFSSRTLTTTIPTSNEIANAVWQRTGGRTVTNSIPTSAEIRDEILNRQLSQHLQSGSVGKKLSDIVSDVLAKTPAQYTAGQVGYLVGTIPATAATNVWATTIGGSPASTVLGGLNTSISAVPANVWTQSINSNMALGTAGRKLADIAALPGVGGDLILTEFVVNDPEGDPVAGATVMFTLNGDGSGIIASAVTDSSGMAKFWLGAGTYYAFAQKVGYNIPNPTTITVTQ